MAFYLKAVSFVIELLHHLDRNILAERLVMNSDICNAITQYIMMLKCVEASQLALLTRRLIHAEEINQKKLARLSQANGNGDETGTGNNEGSANTNENGAAANGDENGPSNAEQTEDQEEEEEEEIDYDNDEITEEDKENLQQAITAINKKLFDLGFTISLFLSQDSPESAEPEHYYCLINNEASVSSFTFTLFTPLEIKAINHLVDAMFKQTNNDNDEGMSYSLYPATATNIISYTSNNSTGESSTSSTKNISTSQADEILRRLESSGWLSFIPERKYTLSDRALCELSKQLISTYGARTEETPDGSVSICSSCHDIVTRGYVCAQDNCYVCFHYSCRESYASAHVNGSCPREMCQGSVSLEDMQRFY